MTQLVLQVTYREDVGEEGRESEKSIQDGEEVKNKRSLGMSSRQTSTLSQVRKKMKKIYSFLNSVESLGTVGFDLCWGR